MKSVLILSYSNLCTDPRVLRQIDALSGHYKIITAGLFPSNSSVVTAHINLKNYKHNHNSYISILKKYPSLFYKKFRGYFYLRTIKNYDRYYWDKSRRETLQDLYNLNFDIIIANDADSLPLAVALKYKTKSKIFFDAHEYSPLEFEENDKWKKIFKPYYLWLCKKFISETDYCTTVSNGLAKEYEKLTNKRFSLIYNAPEFVDLAPKKTTKTIKFVHHGAAIPARNLELMILTFTKLSKEFELHLILIKNSPAYFQKLSVMAKPYLNIFFS